MYYFLNIWYSNRRAEHLLSTENKTFNIRHYGEAWEGLKLKIDNYRRFWLAIPFKGIFFSHTDAGLRSQIFITGKGGKVEGKDAS